VVRAQRRRPARAGHGSRTPARPWVFSLDPGSPALRSALDVGGRGITVLDGQIVVLGSDADPSPLVDVVDVPLTLCGLSTHNVANALAASLQASASACRERQ
jgi:cyanophycin synthetase